MPDDELVDLMRVDNFQEFMDVQSVNVPSNAPMDENNQAMRVIPPQSFNESDFTVAEGQDHWALVGLDFKSVKWVDVSEGEQTNEAPTLFRDA